MSKQVLIVDDCDVTVRMLARLMSDLGFEAIGVASADIARDILNEENTPDLILMDWMMPGMNGLELINWLRGSALHKETPILMVTAKDGISNVAEALGAGANEYIIKPFSRESIEEKLSILGLNSAE
jgi:two-component system chemotaxis response regulator CheY